MLTRFPARLSLGIVAGLILGGYLIARVVQALAENDQRPAGAQRFVEGGIEVELLLKPAGEANATVQLRLSDAATHTPMSGWQPAAWMEPLKPDAAADPDSCRKEIQTFLGAALGARALVDLNSYHVLALNEDASITVIDPLFGYGGSKLLAMVLLDSPGEDWVLTRGQDRLFVSLPQSDQVAVVDTRTWKLIRSIQAGPRPTRLALQPDEKYLWVGNDAPEDSGVEGGVTVIDVDRLEVAALLPGGRGHHELAFTADNHFAFATSEDSGTLTVIDVRQLKKVQELRTGAGPVSLAWSAQAGALYVAHRDDGTIAVIRGDESEHQVASRIQAEPGLRALRFAPGGRLGFVLNGKESLLHILDTATDQLVQTGQVGEDPDQVVFTETLAYVRSRRSELVWTIPLEQVGRPGPIPLVDFPGGQSPVGEMSWPSLADGIAPAPEGAAVLVANPQDRAVYYYKEGMAAPMGSFQNYGHTPRAVRVVDRSLRETKPGTYATQFQLPPPGRYRVAFFLDSPRILHCFDVTLEPSSSLLEPSARPAIRVEPLPEGRTLPVGQEVPLRFRVLDARTDQPKVGLKDVGTLVFVSSGTWQKRRWARPVGEGVYEVGVELPREGIYFVFWECPSLAVRYQELPYLVLHATNR